MNRPSGPKETNSARNEEGKPDHKGRQGRWYQRGPQRPHSPGSPSDKDLGNYLQWAAKQQFYTRGGQWNQIYLWIIDNNNSRNGTATSSAFMFGVRKALLHPPVPRVCPWAWPCIFLRSIDHLATAGGERGSRQMFSWNSGWAETAFRRLAHT